MKRQLAKALRRFPRPSTDLSPVTLSGVVVPLSSFRANAKHYEYKLVAYGGLEYGLLADENSRRALLRHSWEDVEVVGLLNRRDRTVIPQRVYPKGPTGEKETLLEYSPRQRREILEKVSKVVTDWIFVPAALWTLVA